MVSKPKAPDPVATAQAQSGMNLDTALTQQLVNFTNQEGPWGSTNYTPTGTNSFVNSQGQTIDVPQFTQSTTYSPEQQAIFDKTTQAQTNIADIASQQSGKLMGYLGSNFDFNGGQQFQGPSPITPSAFNPAAYQSGQQFNAPEYQGSSQFSSGMSPFSPSEFSYSNASPFNPQDVAFNNQDAANWSYDLASQRILPQQQKDRQALETQLVNKGIRPGTAAWNSELQRLGQSQNDQNNQLALTGRQQAYGEQLGLAQQNYNQQIGARQLNDSEALSSAQQNYTQGIGARQQNFNEAFGTAQQNANQSAADQTNRFNQLLAAQQQNYNQQATDQTNAFGQDMAAWQGNTNTQIAAQQAAYQQALAGRQQNFQEAVTGRNQPINEITALLSGSQIANPNTGFSGTPQSSVAGVDYTGLVNNNYNQQLASSNAALGGLFGLAGTAATAGIKYSDARVKRDISRVGTLNNGLPVYAYRYVWGGPMQIGVMAQDVEQVRPWAVHDLGGIKGVDYAEAVR